ncbi:branched-chain amino acid ABC transporter permease [Pseudonocardia acaciae]|uniref:branched-chain amino acid ABC transporter permease n=1 Tax=Pseudonocardia acaciae TaxID=551276 RepID=UPI0005602F65|nr:branched-chain amino acid ABC transporter permease [Pseudonocardia acaciae]
MSAALQVLFGGVVDGCVYALVAVGMSLVYSMTRVINLAQGGFVVLAALVTVSLQQAGLAPLVALVVALVGFGAGMAGVDRLVIRPAARRSGNQRMLLVTVGLLQAVGGLLLVIWGNLPYTGRPFTGGSPIVIAGVSVQPQQLWILALLAVAVLALTLLLTRTELGLTMRATASRPEAAELVGVDTDRVRLIAFALSGVMAALAGASVVPITFLQFDTTTTYAVAGFIAAVLGGLGSVGGAVLGGLALGVVQAAFSRYTGASLAQVVTIVLLIALLLVRPAGLLGRVEEVRR